MQRGGGRGIVYVVDDEEPVCDSIAMLLRAAGLTAMGYTSGQEFLAAFSAEKARCVLIDGHMPGLDGLQMVREMRRRGHDIPVVVMSGDDDLPWAVAFRASDAVQFLQKPFSEQQLLAIIDRAAHAHCIERRVRRAGAAAGGR